MNGVFTKDGLMLIAGIAIGLWVYEKYVASAIG